MKMICFTNLNYLLVITTLYLGPYDDSELTDDQMMNQTDLDNRARQQILRFREKY